MSEDMTVRGFTASTQGGYLAAVENFTAFLGRSPDQASAEDLRRYQLHMRSNGASAASMNSAVSALRFFFGVTLGRGDAQVGMTTVREPRKLPVVLSPEEVARLLDAARSSSPGGPQVPGDAKRGLRRRPAGVRGGLAQARRHQRQRPGRQIPIAGGTTPSTPARGRRKSSRSSSRTSTANAW